MPSTFRQTAEEDLCSSATGQDQEKVRERMQSHCCLGHWQIIHPMLEVSGWIRIRSLTPRIILRSKSVFYLSSNTLVQIQFVTELTLHQGALHDQPRQVVF